ncbi:N-acetylglutamate synthase, CG3035 family [Nocardia camponoti]|uniref:N-acetyltransferase n=1 Tax=Nocardia camponoti TaxID=1616106 RepID=A0A917QI74_9NOCA|nr:GNAT family N-acetyltransferase [Nocardia camponoti]GGK51762.1 N-acetyltransferase [Nocardia camponoti]
MVDIGKRVVLRYELPPGSPQPLTDVIGELVSLTPVSVRTPDGAVVTVEPDRVVALKAVGPRPIRIGEIRSLEAAAAAAWPGLDQLWLDGWLARVGNGYTGRANSAVPLGDSGAPAALSAETMERIAGWYAERGQPLLLQLPDRLAPVPTGWNTWSETAVLGLDIANFVLPQGPSMVRFAETPDDGWLAVHQYRGEIPTEPAPRVPDRAVLTAIGPAGDGVLGFATLGLPDPLAIGRAAVTTAPDGRRWVGLTCVAVAEPHRGHGLGSLVCAEMIRWGAERGATHAYVQVEVGNAGALALYRDLGFLDHHTYRYAAPAGS